MTDEWCEYAVLVSLYTREEAEVMASALRADGVDAFTSPLNHQGMTWFYLMALGGVRVLVPRDQLEESRLLIRERLRENAGTHLEERVGRRDRAKIWVMAAVLYGINGDWMFCTSMNWPPEEKYDAIEWISGITSAPFWPGK
ncbi:MAG: hypothetical protein R3C46_02125 [Hyphomonadaceae bacterium]